MKKIIIFLMVFTSINISYSGNIFSLENHNLLDDINAEPFLNKPHYYIIGIKFSTIESVKIHTNIIAESRSEKKEDIILPDDIWTYNSEKNLLIINRDVDESKYIVRVFGKYQLPLCIVPFEKIIPEKIRLVVEDRIGIEGKDYIYNELKNEIQLCSCKTGKEKYFLNYDYNNGGGCISSTSISTFTRSLLIHLNCPYDGNSAPLDNEGISFSPHSSQYKNVWLVQLLPKKDGYTGKEMRGGFHWDASRNKLLFDIPVDTRKFSVLIYGEEI
ncbi:MAG: hypothetical protein JW864_02465 [Spirochaetes bacterium]|nr:hypothetical protein [Spirochaetota bacterium]